MRLFPWLLLCLLAVDARADVVERTAGAAAAAVDRRIDEHSYAEPAKVRTKNLSLDLTIDFRANQIAGTATLDLEWIDPAHRRLVLDTRDLKIAKVEGLVGQTWKPLAFTLGNRHPIYGSALAIAADASHAKVRVTYRTSVDASGLQWLPAKLTTDGKEPFMFSQSQAIHARSWIPVQDTPAVRFTYTARIRTPKHLVALMSADNDPKVTRDGDYQFTMPQPIPAYLLAIAVGDLVFEPISERSGVWAERSMVAKAAAEFADTEKMIQVTEALYGPYRWTRYDLLILPLSFPFGGMENPRLSFITPTVIAGDRSLVGLIAHELAHSWSGNLVTNATWKDIWLNEGLTSYVENRITEAVYGRELADIEDALSQSSLRQTVEQTAPELQRLRVPPSPGKDPDELTEVAYSKGQWFMKTLEQRFGRARFDAFLRTWFDRHAFDSVTTEDFVAFLRTELLATRPNAVGEVELADWLDGAGVPKFATATTSARLAAVDAARKQWLDGKGRLADLVLPAWTTNERVHFLEQLPDSLPPAQLAELDRAMALTGTRNVELAQRWYPLAIRSGSREVRPAIAAFVEKIGRRKLIIPTYRALAATPDGLAFAKRTFARVRANYHPLTIASVSEVLEAKPQPKP